ncbi:uncharacterized protein odam isoform 2-T2 [Aulostomus maculatus]
MKLQSALLVACLFRTSFALPVQIGILASNSNEILRLNGLTLATLGQTQYVLQQQPPEVLLTPQVVNLNPQVTGPFGPQGPQLLVPTQGHQPVIIPNGQQEQQLDPNAPTVPQVAQNPVQMFPQFQFPAYAFPHLPRQQGFAYFMPPYGYPQQRSPVVLQPNKAQHNLERTTQRPQLPLQQASQPKLQTDKKDSTTLPPDPRGDTFGPGMDEGHSFPFLFEP